MKETTRRNAEKQKETEIAVIAMPDGSVVSGEIEKCMIIANKIANVTINGIKYTTSIDNVVIIKGGVGIQEE